MNKPVAFVYIRVSTKRQAEEGYSIPEQIERLKKYAESMGWIIGHIYIDDGYSGSSMDRPDLQHMLRDIDTIGCDIVLVDKIDRLARNLLDTVTMVDQIFKKKGIAFVSRAESFDTSTPVGKACMVMMAMFAEMERERISERMHDGKRGRAKEGLWHGGTYTPVGYYYDKSKGTLIIDDEKAEHVRIVFDLFANGMPFRQIERYMEAHGYTNGRGKFSAKSIRYIVGNKVYLGHMKFDDEWVPGIHQPIIDQETFDKAAERLQYVLEHKDPNSRGSKYYQTHFGGFIFCEHCGSLYVRTYGGGIGPDGKRRKYYTCINKTPRRRQNPMCDNKNFSVEKFDKYVFDQIRSIHLNPKLIDNLQKGVDHDTPKALDKLKKQIDNLNKQRSRYMDLYSLENIDLDDLKNKLDTINQQIATIREDMSQLESRKANRLSRDEGMTVIKSIVELLDNNGDLQDIRKMLAIIIERISVDGSNITIHWKFL